MALSERTSTYEVASIEFRKVDTRRQGPRTRPARRVTHVDDGLPDTDARLNEETRGDAGPTVSMFLAVWLVRQRYGIS